MKQKRINKRANFILALILIIVFIICAILLFQMGPLSKKSRTQQAINSQTADVDTTENSTEIATETEEETESEEDRIRAASREKYLSYEQAVDENGIAIDLRDNPVFDQKMEGYDYPEPQTIVYDSGVTNTQRHATVLFPINYDPNQSYPVLYLLHGQKGTHKTWVNKKANIILCNLMYFRDVTPMIVVLPNCQLNDKEDLTGYSNQIQYYDKAEEDIVNYLKPYIEEHYPVKTGPENTAIAGNSLGGRNSANTAFKHPDQFGYIGLFSAANFVDDSGRSHNKPLVTEAQLVENQYKLIFMSVGKSDTICGWVTYDAHERFTRLGINHVFFDVEGGHDDVVWQNAIYNFAQLLFK